MLYHSNQSPSLYRQPPRSSRTVLLQNKEMNKKEKKRGTRTRDLGPPRVRVACSPGPRLCVSAASEQGVLDQSFRLGVLGIQNSAET